MKKKWLIFFGLGILLLAVFLYTISSTWKAIKPAWFDSGVTQSEIISQSQSDEDNPFIVHEDFKLEIIDADLNNPRVLIEDSLGQILISEPSESRVSVFVDDNRETLIENLNRPHGLAIINTTLFVAETGQVLAFDYNEKSKSVSNKQVLLDLPAGGNHWTRTLGVGPDDKLYISVGSSCNICVEDDWRRTKILKYNPISQELSVFASGLRNAVFFAWHPVTKELFATEMGRDWLGDDLPPDELNIVKEGVDYGFPYCYGKNIVDPEFNRPKNCENTTGSMYDFIAHEAPLGIDFHENDAVIALHGSWNRSEPVGYEVIMLSEETDYQERTTILSGFLQEDGTAIGRPAGVLVHSDGSIFISDDKSDLLFHLIPQD